MQFGAHCYSKIKLDWVLGSNLLIEGVPEAEGNVKCLLKLWVVPLIVWCEPGRMEEALIHCNSTSQ